MKFHASNKSSDMCDYNGSSNTNLEVKIQERQPQGTEMSGNHKSTVDISQLIVNREGLAFHGDNQRMGL